MPRAGIDEDPAQQLDGRVLFCRHPNDATHRSGIEAARVLDAVGAPGRRQADERALARRSPRQVDDGMDEYAETRDDGDAHECS